MTLKELSQLYYLNREIERDQERVDNLRRLAEGYGGGQSNGMPFTNSAFAESKIERYVAEIVDIQAIIAAKIEQCAHERNRLERYIADIKDPITREIFRPRFINGLSWARVAEGIGAGYTEDCVRQKFYRYIKKN